MNTAPFIGPSYNLASRPASVQRTVNMMPVPVEPGNDRAGWVFKDVPGLTSASTSLVPVDVYPPSGLFYADFNDGTGRDLIAPAAPPTAGNNVTITSGRFYCRSPVTAFAQRIFWSASKLQQIYGVAWTLEGVFNWTTIPNATVRRIARFDFGTGGSASQLDLAFSGNLGVVKLNVVGGAVITSAVMPSGVDTHWALVMPDASNIRLYMAGNLIGSATVTGPFSSVAGLTLGIGNDSDQGTENYNLNWIRLSLGELYTGSTYTPP